LHGPDPAETPLGGDHLIDQVGFDGVLGLEFFQVGFVEFGELGRDSLVRTRALAVSP
jgi:hypothetical protein